jgi:hypothetical protein
MIVAGIDPGKDGGYCVLDHDGRLVLKELLSVGLSILVDGKYSKLRPDHVFVEKAQVMNKDRGNGVTVRPSAVAMFTYGQGFGEILGILRTLKIPHTLVRPADWCRVMHMGTKATTVDKQRSFEAASRLFPSETWMVQGRRLPHDGLCEAALIAEFGRRTLGMDKTVLTEEMPW